MGHGSTGPTAADQPGCRVLPVIEEEETTEPEMDGGEGSPEMTRLAERRKAIVARMRELLSRAAAAQSARHKLRRSTVATAKKWKSAVGRIQRRGNKNHQQVVAAALQEDDGMLTSSSSSISSQSSFSWDAAAAAAAAAEEQSCYSAASASSCLSLIADRSPLLWPAFVSMHGTTGTTTTADQRSPANSVLRLSCGSSWSEDGDDMRMAHWVTTDSDFVVLEL